MQKHGKICQDIIVNKNKRTIKNIIYGNQHIESNKRRTTESKGSIHHIKNTKGFKSPK